MAKKRTRRQRAATNANKNPRNLNKSKNDDSDDENLFGDVGNADTANIKEVPERRGVTNKDLRMDPPKGLINLGNTCFFNSVMQNLCRTPGLIHALRKLQDQTSLTVESETAPTLHCKLPPLFKLTQALLNFLLTMNEDTAPDSNVASGKGRRSARTGRTRTESPRNLFNQICSVSPRFRGYQQQDSQELLRTLLDGIKMEEIKRRKQGILMELNLLNKKAKDVDPELRVRVKAYGESVTDQPTIVDNLFSGMLVSSVLCDECGRITQVTEEFLDISLPIVEGVPTHHPHEAARRNHKSNNMQGGEEKNSGPEDAPPATPTSSKHALKKMKKQARKGKKQRGGRNKMLEDSKDSHEETEEKDVHTKPLQMNGDAKCADGTEPMLHNDQNATESYEGTGHTAPVTNGEMNSETQLCDTETVAMPLNKDGAMGTNGTSEAMSAMINGAAEPPNPVSIPEDELSSKVENLKLDPQLDTELQDESEDTDLQTVTQNDVTDTVTLVANGVSAPHIVNALPFVKEKRSAEITDVEHVSKSDATEAMSQIICGATYLNDVTATVPSMTNDARESKGDSSVSESELITDLENLVLQAELYSRGELDLQKSLTNEINDLNRKIEKAGVDSAGEIQKFQNHVQELERNVTVRKCRRSKDKDILNADNAAEKSCDAIEEKAKTLVDDVIITAMSTFSQNLNGFDRGDNFYEKIHGKNENFSTFELNNNNPNFQNKNMGLKCEYMNSDCTTTESNMVNGSRECDTKAPQILGNLVVNGDVSKNEMNSSENCSKELNGDENSPENFEMCKKNDKKKVDFETVTVSSATERTEPSSGNDEKEMSVNEQEMRTPLQNGPSLFETPAKVPQVKFTSFCSKLPMTLGPRYEPRTQECSIESCLHKFTMAEMLTGNNKFGCEGCTKAQSKGQENPKTVYCNASKQMLIKTPPLILTLHLKRFQQAGRNLRKFSKRVSIPVRFDLAPFCSSESLIHADKGSQINYRIFGIVEHSGCLSRGHYTAYVNVRQENKDIARQFAGQCNGHHDKEKTEESESDGCWYHISDTSVSKCTLDRALSSNAYLIFYERIF